MKNDEIIKKFKYYLEEKAKEFNINEEEINIYNWFSQFIENYELNTEQYVSLLNNILFDIKYYEDLFYDLIKKIYENKRYI